MPVAEPLRPVLDQLVADALAGSPDEQRRRDAWSLVLAMHGPWELFATLTFKRDVHPEAGDKHFAAWLRELAHRRLGADVAPGIRWVRASERQRRGVLHYHVLLGDIGGVSYRDVHEAWGARRSNVRGFSWIEPPRSQAAVSAYVAKYVTKGGEVDCGGPGFERLGGPRPRPRSSQPPRYPGQERARRKLSRVRHAIGSQDFERLRSWERTRHQGGDRPDELLVRARAAAQPQTTLALHAAAPSHDAGRKGDQP